jgi:hypothetical protein
MPRQGRQKASGGTPHAPLDLLGLGLQSPLAFRLRRELARRFPANKT